MGWAIDHLQKWPLSLNLGNGSVRTIEATHHKVKQNLKRRRRWWKGINLLKLQATNPRKLQSNVSQFHTKKHVAISLIFLRRTTKSHQHSVWKSSKMSHLNFRILAFSTYFWPIKTDLSGNTVWPPASAVQKSPKYTIFAFSITFVHSKYKRSSLRSQCWMRLFL